MWVIEWITLEEAYLRWPKKPGHIHLVGIGDTICELCGKNIVTGKYPNTKGGTHESS